MINKKIQDILFVYVGFCFTKISKNFRSSLSEVLSTSSQDFFIRIHSEFCNTVVITSDYIDWYCSVTFDTALSHLFFEWPTATNHIC